MSDPQTNTGFRIRGPSFFGWIAIVWAALKLKEAHDCQREPCVFLRRTLTVLI